MNKHIVQIILLSMFLLVSQSCNKTDNPISSQSSIEIVPLKIGNSWTTQNIEYDTLGIIRSIDTITISVLKDTIINNVRWYMTQNGIYRNDENGCWQYWYSTPVIVCKYPTSVSDTIKYFNYTTVTLETNVSLTTAIGKSNCYHYLRTTLFDKDVRVHYYTSLGIGNILYEVKHIYGGKEVLAVRSELIRYYVQ